jgi:hypothetical protein
MWGSDYPHNDGSWPASKRIVEDVVRGLAH